jgi:hypothetical protein
MVNFSNWHKIEDKNTKSMSGSNNNNNNNNSNNNIKRNEKYVEVSAFEYKFTPPPVIDVCDIH